MPLLDHFHPPVEEFAPWTSIGSSWIIALMKSLNRKLPANGFRAYANVHLGHMVETDVGEFQSDSFTGDWSDSSSGGLLTEVAPAPVLTFSPEFPDAFEIQILDTRKGKTLVAVIEIVSPSNKDRDGSRESFIRKCAGYIELGIGVALVDPVTDRLANLHNLLMAKLGAPGRSQMVDSPTYVSACRPKGDEDDRRLDVWCYRAPVGAPIPSVPLPLKDGPVVMIDLEGTYLEALSDNGFAEADLGVRSAV